MHRGRVIGIAAAMATLASGAFAQAVQPVAGNGGSPGAHGRKHSGARPITPAAPSRSVDQIRSDLIHGSAAQQELEREDSEQATARPIDHGKDAFFSDWRGIK